MNNVLYYLSISFAIMYGISILYILWSFYTAVKIPANVDPEKFFKNFDIYYNKPITNDIANTLKRINRTKLKTMDKVYGMLYNDYGLNLCICPNNTSNGYHYKVEGDDYEYSMPEIPGMSETTAFEWGVEHCVNFIIKNKMNV